MPWAENKQTDDDDGYMKIDIMSRNYEKKIIEEERNSHNMQVLEHCHLHVNQHSVIVPYQEDFVTEKDILLEMTCYLSNNMRVLTLPYKKVTASSPHTDHIFGHHQASGTKPNANLDERVFPTNDVEVRNERTSEENRSEEKKYVMLISSLGYIQSHIQRDWVFNQCDLVCAQGPGHPVHIHTVYSKQSNLRKYMQINKMQAIILQGFCVTVCLLSRRIISITESKIKKINMTAKVFIDVECRTRRTFVRSRGCEQPGCEQSPLPNLAFTTFYVLSTHTKCLISLNAPIRQQIRIHPEIQ
ncbi:hypothetical protein F2P81_008008 [Scophthalmus maximus]|uniref:Uncharacterized protein n=1 Tax=Scophthalmus maximus TaxID=52904 RepID=A0A6A4T128_SCOMX|nr:hypothetical protein F2P81_008008 [Scophthalmus maximus]